MRASDGGNESIGVESIGVESIGVESIGVEAYSVCKFGLEKGWSEASPLTSSSNN